MLLLLLCHMPDAADVYGVEMPYSKLLTSWQSVYTAFFMQAFFFISGYCSNFKKTFGKFFKDLSKRLLIPVFVYTILIAIVDACFFRSFVPLQDLLSPIFWIRGWHIWFLYAIFLAKLIVWIFAQDDKHVAIKFVFLVAMTFAGIWLNHIYYFGNIFCIYHALIASFFVYLGYWMKKNDKAYNFGLKYIGLLYIPILAIIKLLHGDIPTLTWGLNINLWLAPVFIAIATTGTFMALGICRWINENKFLELWGRNSILIYGVNYFLLGITCSLVYNIFSPNNYIEGFLGIALVFAIVVLICTLLCRLVSRG